MQVKAWKVFPYKYWTTFFTCTFAAVQGAVIGALIYRSSKRWELGWNLELVTILYSVGTLFITMHILTNCKIWYVHRDEFACTQLQGIFATAVTFCMVTWGVSKKGPTYVAMFNPLSLIFVTPAEAFFLSQPVSIGRYVYIYLFFRIHSLQFN